MSSRSLKPFVFVFCATVAIWGAQAWATSHKDGIFSYSSTETVSEAQGILQSMGLLAAGSYKAGHVDGATAEALRAFQRAHSLRTTGRLDTETMPQLLEHRRGGDSDGDGVLDARDRCPNTPRGARVDALGCPAEKKAETAPLPEAGRPLVLEGVNFETDSAKLTPESEAIIDKVADGLRSHPEVKVEVGGHTDSAGRRRVNHRLSKARAEAVRDDLIGKGVPASQMTAVGYGWSTPIASNQTAEGRAKNRRVELSRTH